MRFIFLSLDSRKMEIGNNGKVTNGIIELFLFLLFIKDYFPFKYHFKLKEKLESLRTIWI